jgi:hypothetical protein
LFYYYTGTFCEYTVQGESLYYLTGDPDYTEPYAWGYDGLTQLEFWQAGILITTVNGSAAFEGATVSLMPGIPATLKWKGNGAYGDQCTLKLTNAAGSTIIDTDELADNVSKTWTLSIDNNCNATITGIKTLNRSDASIKPSLSSGFVTVNAETGSVAKVTDLTGRLLKQETITGANQKVELNYTNGIYLITLENGHSRFVQKVILKK